MPPAFEKRILREPIVGRVLTRESKKLGEGSRLDSSTYLIDVGAKQGVADEMHFSFPESEIPHRVGTVVRVAPTTSLVQLYEKRKEHLIGLEATTRRRD